MKLEIALAIPASNKRILETNNSVARGSTQDQRFFNLKLSLMALLAPSTSFEYLCYGCTTVIICFNSFSTGLYFRRPNLTSKVDPHGVRANRYTYNNNINTIIFVWLLCLLLYLIVFYSRLCRLYEQYIWWYHGYRDILLCNRWSNSGELNEWLTYTILASLIQDKSRGTGACGCTFLIMTMTDAVCLGQTSVACATTLVLFTFVQIYGENTSFDTSVVIDPIVQCIEH